MNMIPFQFKRLSPLATVPHYQTEHAAGMDLHAALEDSVEIFSGDIELIPCGFAMSIPEGFEAQVRPRSGLAVRHGVTVLNSPGTIDSDYRGEIQVPLINHGREAVTIEPRMRIAQLVVAPVLRAVFVQLESLPVTARGAGGFGSTGHR